MHAAWVLADCGLVRNNQQSILDNICDINALQMRALTGRGISSADVEVLGFCEEAINLLIRPENGRADKECRGYDGEGMHRAGNSRLRKIVVRLKTKGFLHHTNLKSLT